MTKKNFQSKKLPYELLLTTTKMRQKQKQKKEKKRKNEKEILLLTIGPLMYTTIV